MGIRVNPDAESAGPRLALRKPVRTKKTKPRGNGRRTIDRLVNEHKRLVPFMLGQSGQARVPDDDDDWSNALAGLQRAARKFNRKLGFTFATYAGQVIARSISRGRSIRQTRQKRARQRAIDLGAIGDESPQQYRGVSEELERALAELEKTDRRAASLVRIHFGFHPKYPGGATLEKAGKVHRIGSERAGQIIRAVLVQLRRDPALADFARISCPTSAAP